MICVVMNSHVIFPFLICENIAAKQPSNLLSMLKQLCREIAFAGIR